MPCIIKVIALIAAVLFMQTTIPYNYPTFRSLESQTSGPKLIGQEATFWLYVNRTFSLQQGRKLIGQEAIIRLYTNETFSLQQDKLNISANVHIERPLEPKRFTWRLNNSQGFWTSDFEDDGCGNVEQPVWRTLDYQVFLQKGKVTAGTYGARKPTQKLVDNATCDLKEEFGLVVYDARQPQDVDEEVVALFMMLSTMFLPFLAAIIYICFIIGTSSSGESEDDEIIMFTNYDLHFKTRRKLRNKRKVLWRKRRR